VSDTIFNNNQTIRRNKMPIDYGSKSGDWIELPKVGEPDQEYKIKTCERVEDPTFKYNFMKNEIKKLEDGTEVDVKVNQGFRFVYTTTEDKKFTISSWKPFYAFRDANVQDGDHIKVSHPTKGEWIVTKLSNVVEKPETDIDWSN
jgi:hypothetical protein